LGRSASAPSSIERLQADLFVPSDLKPIVAPSFRLWRSSLTVEELTTTVSRYLGEERTRSSFDSYALTRGISIDPKGEADFQLLLDLSETMTGKTICVLSDSCAAPVVSGIQKFRSEFEAYIAGAREPALAGVVGGLAGDPSWAVTWTTRA